MQLSKKRKTFCNFFLHFWNLHQFFNILKEKMIIIANVFPKLQTVKIQLRPTSKKRCFGTRFDGQHVKACQILVKQPKERFYPILSSFSGKLIYKMSPLALRESQWCLLTLPMASIFSKIVTICNSKIKCNYLKHEKLFLNFLFHFSNLHQILNILKKTIIVIANVFPNLQNPKIFVRPLSKQRRFRIRVDSPHVKASQIFAKSP